MSQEFPSVEELLPHKKPMVLIDRIESFSQEEKRLKSSFVVGEDNIFYDENINGVSNLVAIEYMAQTSAALAELAERNKVSDAKPRPGMLLGTRKLNLLLEKFEKGKRYIVSATDVFDDGTTASFECEIVNDDGDVLATASLTAYRPEDFNAFLKERTGV
jgi:predicted hotdog family 3-hydroxylacyl-ACP dehydratase